MHECLARAREKVPVRCEAALHLRTARGTAPIAPLDLDSAGMLRLLDGERLRTGRHLDGDLDGALGGQGHRAHGQARALETETQKLGDGLGEEHRHLLIGGAAPLVALRVLEGDLHVLGGRRQVAGHLLALLQRRHHHPREERRLRHLRHPQLWLRVRVLHRCHHASAHRREGARILGAKA